MKKYLLIAACCVLACFTNAQTNHSGLYTKEIAVTTENDAYLFQKKDAYYTNGFFIRQTKAGIKKGRKIIRSLELGQMIYTPLIRKTASITDIDRPYCGYLFIKTSQALFDKHAGVFQWSASLGMIGADSYGEGLQDSYHKLFGYGLFTGWNYQVKNAVTMDLSISYAKTLLDNPSWYKIIAVSEAQLGSTFTNAKLGMYTCLGQLNDHAGSALWHARVQNKGAVKKIKKELFLYWYPQLIYQAYNATVEGGLFEKKVPTEALSQTARWMYQQAWGLCFAENRWTTKLALVYQSKEAVTQKNPQRYGSLELSYRLH